MSTIVPPAIAIYAYADDYALEKEFISSIPQEEVETTTSHSNCMDKVNEWMNNCHPKMNSDKTEVILNKLNFSITESYFNDYKLSPVHQTWLHQVYEKIFYFTRQPL